MAQPLSIEAIALPIFTCIGLLIIVVPFICHYKNNNVGTCSLIFYVAVANLFTFVNVIIWPTDDYKNWWLGYGLCDIEAKLQFPYMTGVGCATLCITRSLAIAIDVDRADLLQSRNSKRKKALTDLVICFAIPLLQIFLHYIVQPNRYFIEPIGGCAASFDNSWPTVLLMFMWPLILCLVNCYYVFLIYYRLRKLRFSSHESLDATLSRRSNLTSAQYFRLSTLVITLLVVYTPVSIYFFCLNMNIVWLSYDWDAIHYPFETWVKPVYLPRRATRVTRRWIGVLMSIFLFLYFGLAVDAREIYRQWLLNLGFGRLFPGLKAHPTKESGWINKLSLTRRVRLYFEGLAKKPPTTVTTRSDTEHILSSHISRKESFAVFEHTLTSFEQATTSGTGPSTVPLTSHQSTVCVGSDSIPAAPAFSAFPLNITTNRRMDNL